MKAASRFLLLLIVTGLFTSMPTRAAEPADSVRTDSVKKHPWRAAGEIAVINLLVMGYDHLFLDMPCYQVTSKSIKNNFQVKKWWWDADYYHTNAINHPYHGALYYTAARDNGMNIGVSSLMALGGSLTWEMLCESEPPSFNDLVTTPIGGITLGEPMHRISDKVIDNSKRGIERVGRELVAALIDPVKGLNRLIRGDTWRVRPGADSYSPAMSTAVELGYRYLDVAEEKALATPYLNFNVDYGDVMGTEGNGPFDYFTLNLTATAGKEQPHISCVQVKNQLWSRQLGKKDKPNAVFGFYNHYDYTSALPRYDLPEGQRMRRPYGYLEIASIGPGFAYRTGSLLKWEQQIFVHGIGLGATPIKTVHKKGSNRGYSFGSGYGARTTTDLRLGNLLHARINGMFSQLFTWDGFFADDPNRQMGASGNSIQGEEGNTVTFMAEPSLQFYPTRHIGLGLSGRYFWCHYNFKFHPHETSHSLELHAALKYLF